MNLYHLNTGVDSRVLLNADYDIRRYTDFISNAIKFLEKETLFIKVKKHIAEIETTINGEKKITKETRYIPEPAKNKREEKAIFYNLQKDTGVEPSADDHCVCTGGDRGLQSFGSRHRGAD